MEPEKLRANNAILLSHYFMAVKNHIHQAREYQNVRDSGREYTTLFKAASLIIDTIPKHKDFQQPRYQKQYRSAEEYLRKTVMPRLEKIKAGNMAQAVRAPVRAHAVKVDTSNMPSVNWQQYQPAASVHAKVPANYFVRNPTVDKTIDQRAHEPPPVPFDPDDPFSASMAFSSSTALTPSSVPAAITVSSAPSLLRTRLLSLPSGAAGAQPGALPDWLSSLSLQHRSNSQSGRHSLLPVASVPSRQPAASVRPQYPTIAAPAPAPVQIEPKPPLNIPLPPQEVEVKQQLVTEVVAPPPGATCDHAHHGPCTHHAHHAEPSAPPPPETPSSSGASGGALATDELRTVYLHPGVMDEFMAIAQSNTRRGIESAGLLAGTFSARENSFTISRLFIPKQKGEPNNVEMLNEEDLVEHFFDEANESVLVILGWIHTHPTQSCFLSSIDVHTQCGYQTGSAEAMAIVMAPTDPRCKCNIFRLTTPGGLRLIQGCEQRGFHAHPPPDTGQEIFELCGHVFLDETAKFKTVDLR